MIVPCLVILSAASLVAFAPMIQSHGDPLAPNLSDSAMKAGRAAAGSQQNQAINQSARNGGN